MSRETRIARPSPERLALIERLAAGTDWKGPYFIEVEKDENGVFPTQEQIDDYFLHRFKQGLKGGKHDHNSY